MRGDNGKGATRGRVASPARGRIAAAAVAAVLVALAVLVAWALLRPVDGGFFDPAARQGQAPWKTPEELQAELDRTVEEGMFNISIASVVEFPDGASPGTAWIENVPGNRYAMKVSIALDGTGETVYESGGLAPGSYIESIALVRDLDPGEYAATATFSAHDQESFAEVGRAAAKITLIVRG